MENTDEQPDRPKAVIVAGRVLELTTLALVCAGVELPEQMPDPGPELYFPGVGYVAFTEQTEEVWVDFHPVHLNNMGSLNSHQAKTVTRSLETPLHEAEFADFLARMIFASRLPRPDALTRLAYFKGGQVFAAEIRASEAAPALSFGVQTSPPSADLAKAFDELKDKYKKVSDAVIDISISEPERNILVTPSRIKSVPGRVHFPFNVFGVIKVPTDFTIQRIKSNRALRLRLYTGELEARADWDRGVSVRPSPGSGLLLEVVISKDSARPNGFYHIAFGEKITLKNLFDPPNVFYIITGEIETDEPGPVSIVLYDGNTSIDIVTGKPEPKAAPPGMLADITLLHHSYNMHPAEAARLMEEEPARAAELLEALRNMPLTVGTGLGDNIPPVNSVTRSFFVEFLVNFHGWTREGAESRVSSDPEGVRVMVGSMLKKPDPMKPYLPEEDPANIWGFVAASSPEGVALTQRYSRFEVSLEDYRAGIREIATRLQFPAKPRETVPLYEHDRVYKKGELVRTIYGDIFCASMDIHQTAPGHSDTGGFWIKQGTVNGPNITPAPPIVPSGHASDGGPDGMQPRPDIAGENPPPFNS